MVFVDQVVDEQHTQTLPEAAASAHVVKAEWFWASVQNEEAQDEKDYLFEDVSIKIVLNLPWIWYWLKNETCEFVLLNLLSGTFKRKN